MHRPIGAVDVKKGKVVTLWTENRTKKVNDRSIRRNRYKNNGVRRKIVKRKIKIKESIRYEIRKLETTTRYKSGCRANVEVTESARDRQKKKILAIARVGGDPLSGDQIHDPGLACALRFV